MSDDWDNEGSSQEQHQNFSNQGFSQRQQNFNNDFRGQRRVFNNSNYQSNDSQNNRGRRYNSGQNDRRNRESSRSRSFVTSDEQSSFYVETSMLGKIIGRGGSQIRELQEQSGCRVNVNKECTKGDYTLMTATGSDDAQSRLKSILEDLMGKRVALASELENDETNRDGHYQNSTNDYSNNADSYNNSNYQSNDFQNNRGRKYNSGQNDRRNRESADSGGFVTSDEQSSFYVETSMLGKIIGRGGCNIRELQDQSGCKLNVNKDCTKGDHTLITITGSSDAQSKVISMLEDVIGKKVTQVSELDNYESRDSNYQSSANYQSSNDYGKTADTDTLPHIDWDAAAKECEDYLKVKWAQYPPVIKNFYKEDPIVANMTKEQADQIRLENNNINVEYTFDTVKSGDDEDYHIPNPVVSFEQAFQNYPDILTEIRKQGFEKPSPIQCQAWPVLLSGKDMIGIAQTGTGKTLAFLLPALIHIDNQTTPREKRCGPTVLVMAPTRELALQIEKEVNKYDYHGIKAICVYGGGDRKQQMNTLSKGVEIVIATPGRLNDLVQTEVLDVKCVSYLVLDEADRMLDMGFEPQIRKTLLDVRPDRQSVMTSATWPPGVRRLATSYMKSPITVCVGTMDLKAVHSVTQKIHIVEEEDKTDYLRDFFHSMTPEDKVIVFFGKKVTVDDIGSDLALSGVKCQSIHGGREQSDREQALEDIKNGTVRILLATDVASRGIDIEDITHVFNYDFPRDIEEYVHRVGRTGRAGRTGESISLMTRRDWAVAGELLKILEEAEQEIPDEIYNMAERYEAMKQRRSEEGNRGDRRHGGGGGGGGGGRGGRRGGGRNIGGGYW